MRKEDKKKRYNHKDSHRRSGESKGRARLIEKFKNLKRSENQREGTKSRGAKRRQGIKKIK